MIGLNEDYAKTIDAEIYKGFKYYDKTEAIFGKKLADFIGGVDNALWLINKMIKKYNIVDFGLDVERATRSPYYLMESVLSYLYKYKDYAEVFSQLIKVALPAIEAATNPPTI